MCGPRGGPSENRVRLAPLFRHPPRKLSHPWWLREPVLGCKRLNRSVLLRGPRPRRRFVPPSPSVSVLQSMKQRWRERPRCPALRVTPGRRDGVVHAIVGRVARRRFRAVNVPDETRRPCARLRVEIRQKNTTRETHRNLFWRVEGISGRSVTVTDADPGVAPSRS